MAWGTRLEMDQRERQARARTILSFFGLLLGVLVLRLFWLQVVQFDENYRLSEKNRMRMRTVVAERGSMYDRFGNVLVRNRASWQVMITRADMRDPEELKAKLVSLRDGEDRPVFDSALVAQTFEVSKWRNKYAMHRILEDASPEVVAFLSERASEFPGLSVEVESRREYVYGTLGTHAFGYIAPIDEKELEKPEFEGYPKSARVGKKGLEASYERFLRGKDGVQHVEVDAFGRKLGLLKNMPQIPARPGNSLVLTLDLELQRAAEEAFPDTLRGAAVALDPRSGEILAMVSSPRLESNIFSLDSVSRKKGWQSVALDEARPLNNRAVVGVYPPGSTFKPFTALAGLKEGAITETNKPFQPCRGGFRFGKRVQHCWHLGGHGAMNVVDALRVSCNVFFYQLGLAIGMDPINEAAATFGLGNRTGVDLEYENPGALIDSVEYERRYRKRLGWRWSRGQILNLAIGQGELVTPLQMANAYGALVRGDTLWRPHLMRMVVSPEGRAILRYGRKMIRAIDMDEEFHRIVVKGLEEVTSAAGGTGHRAAVPGVRVAAKTGSAENPHGDKTHAWIAAAAPVEDASIAVAVVVENAGHGGGVAGPIAGAILRKHFELLKRRAEGNDARP
ncbi:MAG: penicillin-binding protein 2 [Fibrobacterales bacterium]|nr:penicillin-binding protein 2 [Fibrobacterales bacterium]